MIEERKKIEFWNFLITEKNQARPKGITIQRLAVIKPIAIESDLWDEVIEQPGASERTAEEFYQSQEAAAAQSRTNFWEAVRGIIKQGESERKNIDNHKRYATADSTAGRRRNFKKSPRKR